MKKIILMISIALSLIANEIQVFSTNTMHIKLDKTSKITTIYNGSLNDFYKNSEKILNSKEVTQAVLNSIHSGALSANSSGALYNGSSVDISQMVSGGVGALVGYALGSGITWVVSDNEYVSVSVVTNSLGQSTMIQTLIVANYSLSDSEIKEEGRKALKKLIEKS